MTEDNSRRTVKTTARSFEIVHALREMEGARITELADRLGMTKGTLHRHLSTLYDLQYVVRDGDEYHIGLRFLKLGEYARTRKEPYSMAETHVEELAEVTEERAQFVVEEHGRGLYLHIATGSHAVRTGLRIGHRIHLHSTAAGKIILSRMSDEEVRSIVDRWGLTEKTSKTITDVDELFDEIEAVADRDYAFNREENIDGLQAVAAPVEGPTDELVGVLSVSGPTHRMKGDRFEREIPDILLGSANEFELNIKYS